LQKLALGFRPWGPMLHRSSLHRSSLPVNRSSLSLLIVRSWHAIYLMLYVVDHSTSHQLGRGRVEYLPDSDLQVRLLVNTLLGFAVAAIKHSDGRGNTRACWRSLLPRHGG
jgi:hypothetical protein